MSINRYMQLATLTNINVQSTTWSEIFARQPANDTSQQLLLGMLPKHKNPHPSSFSRTQNNKQTLATRLSI